MNPAFNLVRHGISKNQHVMRSSLFSPFSSSKRNNPRPNKSAITYLLAPLGKYMEAKHALPGSSDELEKIDLLLSIQALLAELIPLLALLYQLLQRQVGVLRRSLDERREFNRLSPQLRHLHPIGRSETLVRANRLGGLKLVSELGR
jgi:hypothetical protein